MAEIVKLDGHWGVLSWTDGFRSFDRECSLDQEAVDNPEAVVNRLMNQGRWDEAERLFDRHICQE